MKKLIAIILVFALAVPLLTACAKPSDAQSETGESSSQGGSALPFDPTVPQNVDSGTYSYYIYDGSETLKEWLGGFGILGYFYRITNSSRVAERILDRPIKEFAGFGTEFVALTKENKIIRFPNIADVPESMITYLGEAPNDATHFVSNGKIACYITGEEAVGVSVDDGAEVFRQKLDGLQDMYFGNDVELALYNGNAFYAYNTETKEMILITDSSSVNMSADVWLYFHPEDRS